MSEPTHTMSATGKAWSPAAETAYPAPDSELMGGRMVRCRVRESVGGARTQARIAEEVAEQAAPRVGTMAILTAITVVTAAILEHALQPEMAAVQQAPLYRLSSLFLVLAGAGVAALQRARLVSPQELLDLGLVFEIAGAFALALIENAAPWPNLPMRGSTAVAAWIAICAFVIPNQPWKSITAAIGSAAMIPCAHLVAAQIIGYPPVPWHSLASYMMSSMFVVAWTPFISIRMHRMREDLSRTQEFGSYQLEKLLGRGGMGEVWLARHRLLRREAAVKLVLGGLLQQAVESDRRNLQKRFEREAQAMASLRSPHTVAIYDYGVLENGSLYYAMEFLSGLDAQRLVDRYGPQPAGRVIAFLGQACESLEEAHDAGLVHRDIKPGNLFICRLGKRTDFVKVLDFGLVKALADSARSLTTVDGTTGTPAYMPPEQVRGEEVDARADIYGLGCVAYFLLTGTVVFNKPNTMSMALAHATERPQRPSERSELPIPQSLERVVMACLEKRPADRPQSVAELRAMLDGCTDIAPWTKVNADQWWALHHPEPVRKASW